MQKKIEEELKKVRPMLQADGGDVEFVAFNEESGVLQVRLLGMCATCPMAQITIKQGIEKIIKDNISEVTEVVGV